MRATDFTNGDNLFRYLGSFWSQIFSDRASIHGMADSDAADLVQLYMDMAACINSVGIKTCVPLDADRVTPILIYKSLVSQSRYPLRFGDGALYGPQDGSLSRVEKGKVLTYGGQLRDAVPVFVPAPISMISPGNVIINRLWDPSVALVRGVDYVLEEGDLVFRDNPFNNPLIPVRQVANQLGEADELIVLWMSEAEYDRMAIHNAGGYIFFRDTPTDVSAEVYAQAVKALFAISAGGPTISAIDSLIAATSGLPLTVEPVETVESIFTFQGDTMVLTDAQVYRISQGLVLRDSIVAGASLRSGSPLTTATRVDDSVSNPGWWNDIPLLTLGENLIPDSQVGGSIGFANASVPVDVTRVVQSTAGTTTSARFAVVGKRRCVTQFWSAMEARSRAADDWLSDRLWQAAGLTNLDGTSDFTEPLLVNPLQLLVEELCPLGFVCVRIAAGLQETSLVSALSQLGELLPAASTIVVILDYNEQEEWSLDFPVEIPAQTSITLTSLDTCLSVDDSADLAALDAEWGHIDDLGQLQTPAAEALSSSISPDIMADTIDMTASAAEDVRISNIPICLT